MEYHKYLPFHHIEKWNGKYFATTTLFDQGHVIHLGHNGNACPGIAETDSWMNVNETMEGLDEDIYSNIYESNENFNLSGTYGEIVVVHTTGVFNHRVQWCKCPNAPDKATQLFQLQLFPASLQNPKTAFTFNCLDYFYMDAMECKTSASSFISKLQRLTNNAFPQKISVS